MVSTCPIKSKSTQAARIRELSDFEPPNQTESNRPYQFEKYGPAFQMGEQGLDDFFFARVKAKEAAAY